MFTTSQVKLAEDFFKVLTSEAAPALVRTVATEKAITIHSGAYSSQVASDGSCVVRDIYSTFQEKGFEDCMVRMRYELMRYLNPAAFQ